MAGTLAFNDTNRDSTRVILDALRNSVEDEKQITMAGTLAFNDPPTR